MWGIAKVVGGAVIALSGVGVGRDGGVGPNDGVGRDEDLVGPTNADLVRRLKRVEGQVRGLQRMIEEGRACSEVLVQLAALREAVNKVGVALIARHMASCLEEPGPSGIGAADGSVAGAPGRSGRLKEAVQMFLKFS